MIKLYLSSNGTLTGAPINVIRQIRKELSMKNPAYIEARKHGRWTGNLDEWLRFYGLVKDGISFPRGYARRAWTLCAENGQAPSLEDCRRTLRPLQVDFQGKLRDYQEKALRDILSRDDGVCEAVTGSGKTVMALAVIEARNQPTLILVHTKELLQQWQDRIKQFLNVDPGKIGAGKMDIQPISVCMVQTLLKHLDTLPEHFGHLVVDECHRIPSSTFSECVKAFDARYLLGLSATPFRRDGLGKLIYWTLGDLVHKVDSDLLRDSGAVLKPEIVTRETDFSYDYRDDYTGMVSALTENQERNAFIAKDIAGNMNGKGSALVVSDRVEHLRTLAGMVNAQNMAVLTGQTPARDRERIVMELEQGNIRVLFSTVQLIGEGFDAAGLTDLYLTTPVKFKGRLLQVVGRILRPKDGKKPRIFDYQDVRQPVLRAQAKTRNRIFQQLGE